MGTMLKDLNSEKRNPVQVNHCMESSFGEQECLPKSVAMAFLTLASQWGIF